MNNVKTLIFLAALTALLVVIGYLIGGTTGVIIALGLGIAMNFSAYWYSDKMVLKMYNAQPLPEDHFVYKAVSMLAQKANTPTPKVYLIDTESPNAFATGRDPKHAAIAVTSGILKRMSQEELIGVLGHELCHVLHRDTFISVVAATIAGAISGVANVFMFGGMQSRNNNGTGPAIGLLMTILAPAAAGLIQMAISRSREFEADKGGAELTGQPLWLASALGRLEEAAKQMPFTAAERHPTTAHLFIVNPLSNPRLKQLFTTHPSTNERIERLKSMAKEAS